MRTVKQSPGQRVCGAACAAMLADVSLDAVLAEVKLDDEGIVTTSEVVRFLASHKILLGLNIATDGLAYKRFSDLTLSVSLRVSDYPALVIVETGRHDKHAIVWDNEVGKFRDPDWCQGEFTESHEYAIVDWLVAYRLKHLSVPNEAA